MSKDVKKKDTQNAFETGRAKWEFGEPFDEFHGWGQKGTGHNGQHCPQAKAEVVLQTKSEMIDLEAELVLSDPYRRVLEEDRPELKCHCGHRLDVRF